MSRTPFLYTLAFPRDLHLGPARTIKGESYELLYYNKGNLPAQAIVFGVVRDIVSDSVDGSGAQLLVLEVPRTTESRRYFAAQAKVLDAMLTDDANKTERALLGEQFWSQGPSDVGWDATLFVRLTENTDKSTMNMKSGVVPEPFRFLDRDAPHVFNKCDPVELGALVVCTVHMFVADFKVKNSSALYQRVSSVYISSDI
ncbi:hypothetical protein B0H13DRAFT_2340666 [Mycena leptocephala]|nr:hypothetical protein B0H13DRAFT_2340666 [Mycena leptocephala]